MKLSVNMWAFNSQNLFSFCSCSEIHFNCFELNCELDNNTILPLNCTKEKLENIKTLLFSTNLANISISSICRFAFISL